MTPLASQSLRAAELLFVVSKINGAMARRSISAFPCARRQRTPPDRRG
jgi:hypothetical protein